MNTCVLNNATVTQTCKIEQLYDWEDEMTVDVALDFRKKTSDESRSIRAINVSHAEMNDRRHSASHFHELLRIIKTTS